MQSKKSRAQSDNFSFCIKREAFVNQATPRKIMPFLLKTLIVVVVGVVV